MSITLTSQKLQKKHPNGYDVAGRKPGWWQVDLAEELVKPRQLNSSITIEILLRAPVFLKLELETRFEPSTTCLELSVQIQQFHESG
jgi:hypothetical protein